MDAEERKKRFTYSERSNIDWHVHTTASDGQLTPTQIIRKAKRMGLEEIAITDHDSIDGVKEATAEGRKLGVKVVPGIELTCYENLRIGKKNVRVEIHMVGLDIDIKDKGLERLIQLAGKARVIRAKKIIQKLKKLGYSISWKRTRQLGRDVTGRPHIAYALLESKKNRDKMRNDYKLDHEPVRNDVFECLIGYGRLAYVEKMKFSVKQAISIIKATRGLAGLAHPGIESHRGFDIPFSKIREYKKCGLDAIEVYCSAHREKQIRKYSRIAKQLGLIATGGTDYHAFPFEKIELGVGRGNLKDYWKK